MDASSEIMLQFSSQKMLYSYGEKLETQIYFVKNLRISWNLSFPVVFEPGFKTSFCDCEYAAL